MQPGPGWSARISIPQLGFQNYNVLIPLCDEINGKVI